MQFFNTYLLIILIIFNLIIDKSIAESQAIAFVLKASGDAHYQTDKTNQWRALPAGIRLNHGDRVKTGAGSLVSIVFTNDKSLMKIRSKSEVMLNTHRSQENTSRYIMALLGELWFNIKANSDFSVETPSGIIKVKGTEFYVNIEKNGKTIVVGIEGQIELKSRFGNSLLSAGQTGFITPDVSPQITSSNFPNIPEWGRATDEGNVLEVEFQDEQGKKKRLKIVFKP